MKCFEVNERVNLELPIVRDGYPRVVTPPTCPQLLLEAELADVIQGMPKGYVRYGVKLREPASRASCVHTRVAADMCVEMNTDHILLKRPLRRSNRQALVLLTTAAGENGKVFLTANAYNVEMPNNKPPVKRAYRAFPDAGVFPCCTDEEVARINKGVQFLDVLVVMYAGASFRVVRDGQLAGASPQMFIHWNGDELRATMPRRYDERASAGFFEAVGA